MSTDRRPRASLVPYLALCVGALGWAGNFVVGRFISDSLPPLTLNLARWTLAFLALLPFTIRGVLTHWSAIRRRWKILALLGLSGVGLFNSLQYIALQDTTAINAALMYSATPVVIVLLSWAIFGERVTLVQGAGVAISLAGAVVVITRGDVDTLRAFDFNRGDLWMLAAVPCWAFYSAMLRLRPTELPPLVLLSVLMGFGLMLLIPMWLVEMASGPEIVVDAVSVACVLYVGLVASLLSYVCWIRGVADLGANRAGLFAHLVPMFSAVLAVALLGEAFGTHHLAGFVLILGGIWLATIRAAARA